MKTIILFLICFFLASCVTQKKCTRKFPPVTEIIIKDSIREVTIYRDTTIYINLPADTVYKKDTIIIKNGYFYIAPMYAETNLATAKAWISHNKLSLMLADKDTTLEVRLENALKTSQIWEFKYKNEKQTVQVKYVPKFWKVTGWIGIISVILIIMYIVTRFYFKII